MPKVIIAFLLLFKAVFVCAAEENFKGHIEQIGPDTFLLVKEGRFSLYSADPVVRRQFQTLNTGDFLSGVASSIQENRIVVESIKFVGLRQLLGYWKSDFGLFDFRDFSKLRIWLQEDSPALSHRGTYQYTMSPSNNDSAQVWNFLLADQNQVFSGFMRITHNTMILTLKKNSNQTPLIIELKKINKLAPELKTPQDFTE